jgi:hypothetical protein
MSQVGHALPPAHCSILWIETRQQNNSYVFPAQGKIFTVPSSNHDNLPIGTTQYQLSADSTFGTQQEFIDLLSSAFDDWAKIIALTKPTCKFIASKIQKDIPNPITIYSEAWKRLPAGLIFKLSIHQGLV